MVSESFPALLILPKERSSTAFVCTLAHPRTRIPSRYFVDPENGIYEFTCISAPKNACRSWILTSHTRENRTGGNSIHCASAKQHSGGEIQPDPHIPPAPLVISKPDLLVATPIDPLFLLLPALCNSSGDTEKSKRLFLSCDDILDKICEVSTHFDQVVRHGSLRNMFKNRLSAACDLVQAGDEGMYRLNEAKLFRELVQKAESTQQLGFPASMEEKFIRRTLEMPVIGVRREDYDTLEDQPATVDTPSSEATNSLDSENSVLTSESSFSSTSVVTGLTTPDVVEAVTDEDIRRLLRVRTILTYMISSYAPPSIAKSMGGLFESKESPVDFTPLEERLAYISKVRIEALAARSLGDYSRKRNAYEDDEIVEMRAEKKRKKEEEEKKKKLESRGIRDLKKVDTTGMKKMSDFFGKKLMTKK